MLCPHVQGRTLHRNGTAACAGFGNVYQRGQVWWVTYHHGGRSTKHWLVTCSCGWEREAASPQLAAVDVPHVTRVEGPAQAAAVSSVR